MPPSRSLLSPRSSRSILGSSPTAGLLTAGALVAALSACAAAPSAEPVPQPRLVVRAARLVDPASGTVTRDVVVVVRGDRIVAVEPASAFRPQTGDEVHELGDDTSLIPGLIDAHVHLTIGDGARRSAAAALRAGVTTVVDLGARTFEVTALRDSLEETAAPFPRILAAGLWIGVRGGVCEFGGIGVAGGIAAFQARVRENLAANADLVKVCVTGWPSVATLHPDSAELPAAVISALVEEAHRGGRRVVAHAISAEGVRRSLDAGVDGLAHAAYVDSSLAARMRERGMWMVSTLASLTAADTTENARRLVASVVGAYRAGVTIVLGTDGGVLPHGDYAREALALAAAGIPAADVLRAATVDAARALGIADSIGAIAPGFVADLVAVRGDPLGDVGALARPAFIMARGRVVPIAP